MIISKIIDITQNITTRSTPSAFSIKIPYYSQWESPQLVNRFLQQEILPRHDRLWKNSGALNPLEYEFWSYHICGIACLKMIVSKIRGIEFKTVSTAKETVSFGCYKPQPITLTSSYRTHPSHIDGVFYKPFCKYIQKKWNLHAQVHQHLSYDRVKYLLASNKFLIISVDPRIREGKMKSTPKPGGHLVVVTGFDTQSNQIIIHNPSGLYPNSQQNHAVSLKIFNQLFAQRGISISES